MKCVRDGQPAGGRSKEVYPLLAILTPGTQRDATPTPFFLPSSCELEGQWLAHRPTGKKLWTGPPYRQVEARFTEPQYIAECNYSIWQPKAMQATAKQQAWRCVRGVREVLKLTSFHTYPTVYPTHVCHVVATYAYFWQEKTPLSRGETGFCQDGTKEIWWSWRDLNPRPQAFFEQFYMCSRLV